MQVHFSESWNELHHLLIMESLGGNTRWADRFVAQHTAFAYFWVTCALYLASPRMAYNLMEQIEEHAFQTYDTFLVQHGEQLKKQPVPPVAAAYYNESDAYLFDEFQTGATPVSDARGVMHLGASETDTASDSLCFLTHPLTFCAGHAPAAAAVAVRRVRGHSRRRGPACEHDAQLPARRQFHAQPA